MCLKFLLAYQRSNSGGVTSGFPDRKYADRHKTALSGTLQQAMQEYYVALKKFIRKNLATVSGLNWNSSALIRSNSGRKFSGS